VRWRDGVVEVEHRHDREVDLRGRGLLLVPTVFAWPAGEQVPRAPRAGA